MVRYCPAGDGSFEDWVERCPDCGRPLVDQPPPPASPPPAPHPSHVNEPIVYLATVPNEPLALMWQQILRDEGITAMIKPTGPGVGAWGSAATFEHQIFVIASDRERAREIMADVESPDADDVVFFDANGKGEHHPDKK